jgi:hypothetical protein
VTGNGSYRDKRLREQTGLPSEKGIPAIRKTPVGILVQRSPLPARLYLFSLNLLFLEVIIRKNAEPGRNNSAVSGGNG